MTPLQHLRHDIYRVRKRTGALEVVRCFLRERTVRPVITKRWMEAAGCLPRPLRDLCSVLARALHRVAQNGAGIDFPATTRVGPGLKLSHAWGIVINENAIIGANATLFNGVVLGRKDNFTPDGGRVEGASPVIEDEVWIGPQAIIIGDVTIGRGSIVGAGAVVTRSVPERSVVAGNPARVIRTGVAPDVLNKASILGTAA